jgi:dipeptidyl aminopeptidase/acylaminoacyl peptidase
MLSRVFIALAALLTLAVAVPAGAQSTVTEVCPAAAVVPRPREFAPGGLILTTFDRRQLWVVDVRANSRYPLEGAVPCGTNCQLSPDARTISYLDGDERTYNTRALDGTQERVISNAASDLFFWSDDTLLVWTPAQRAFLRREGQDPYELDAAGAISVQPGGFWALTLTYDPETGAFSRRLVNTALRRAPDAPMLDLGPESRFAAAARWSPDGTLMAYARPLSADDPTAELYVARPSDKAIVQATDLTGQYGAQRLGGTSVSSLSWSPDSQRIAFWAAPLPDPSAPEQAGAAYLFVHDLTSGQTRRYCGYTTTGHTPNPPRLMWSPDGTHIAFAGDLENDGRGFILFALDVSEGVFYEMSAGVYPALGAANVLAWGLRP